VGELFREHNQTLVRFLNARLGSEQEAKEIAQEAYVKLLQLERRVAISFMRAYLFRIAANLAIDRIRQRKSQGLHEDIDLFEELEDSAAPERTVMAAEELERIVRFVEELPKRCAEAFVLHRFHGLRPSEVASAMRISDRMVRNHLVRALVYCKLRIDGCSAQEALARTKE
jgi:RNA polymerase sigma-70 factor (ECF subfamily)